ncbi:MAG TPA: ATP-binding cassette domain-containing protein [Gammaproteobacteria bacterium]|nr:ATP-binding cassette domain-containing protein [Gammaproteobacteria bacterium]
MPIIMNFKNMMRLFLRKPENRRYASKALLANIGMQAAVFVAIMPQNDPDTEASTMTTLPAVLVPMVIDGLQTMLYLHLQAKIKGEVESGLVETLYGGNPGVNDELSKNIALITTLANDDLRESIESMSQYVDYASNSIEIAGNISNIIPMVFFWTAANKSLPENARSVLYIATGATVAACFVQKLLADRFIKHLNDMEEQGSKARSRLGAGFRHARAIASGEYQLTEAAVINGYIQKKQVSAKKFATYLGLAVALHRIMTVSLMNVLRIVVGSLYPETAGTASLDIFSITITYFATYLLAIIYSLTEHASKASLGLKKLQDMTSFFAELNEFKEISPLTTEYNCQLEDDVILKLNDFTVAIPTRKFNSTVVNNVRATLTDLQSIFTFYGHDLMINKGDFKRVVGPSGAGKTTLGDAVFGNWPFARGTVQFACDKTQIYIFPQEQLFVYGSLLENIFYPEAVPDNFAGSELETRVHRLMRIIGLEKEINRLAETKNWEGNDLSPGLKKRFSFLRGYLKTITRDTAPQLLWIDEMTSGVDAESADCMNKLINQLRAEFPDLAVVFIKHEIKPRVEYYTSAQRDFKQQNIPTAADEYTTTHISALEPDLVRQRMSGHGPIMQTATAMPQQRTMLFTNTRVQPAESDDDDVDLEEAQTPVPPRGSYGDSRCIIS